MSKLLVDYHFPSLPKERAPSKEVRRTYNICENRVVDHKSGSKVSFDNFNLDDFIGV